jgi:hypothetical protein
MTSKLLTTASTFILASALVMTSFFVSPISVSAQTSVPKDRTTPINVFFPYGSATSDTDIRNALARLSIDNPAMTFVTSSTEDWYNGNPTRPDSEQPPAQPACNSSYSGPKYPMNASLVSGNLVNYGLQSSRTAGTAGGSATAATLREKHTGCIRVQVLVSPTATVGDTITVSFNEDASNSPDYQAQFKPPVKTVRFVIAAAQNPVSSSSPNVSSAVSSQSAPTTSIPASSTPTFSGTGSSVAVTTPSTNINNTPRSGGAELAAVAALAAILGGGLLFYKQKKSRSLSKIDIVNK